MHNAHSTTLTLEGKRRGEDMSELASRVASGTCPPLSHVPHRAHLSSVVCAGMQV